MQYPNNIKKKNKKALYSNRGMDLENLINITNEYYIEKKKAFIYKKPTPIGIADVDYKLGVIKKAYFKEPSTLDYNGLYKGYYIEFEAKETKNKTSLPLANIHKHQINHLTNIINNDGIGFLIISINNEIYLLNGKDFLNYIENNARKSIPYDFIKEKGYLLKPNINGIDYLNILDKYIIGG